MAKRNDKLEVKFEGNVMNISFTDKEDKRSIDLKQLPQDVQDYLLRRGARQMIGLAVLEDKTADEAIDSIDDQIASWNESILPSREGPRSFVTSLNISAYQLFKRFTALNHGKPDPQISRADAAKEMENLSEEQVRAIKGEKTFRIAYTKVRNDASQAKLAKELAEMEAKAGQIQEPALI